ncbi:MAG: type I methionyl aminopeptidase [Gammaproteobacteria bacterium]
MKLSQELNDLISKMRIASRIAASTLEMIGEYVKPGVTTNKLNEICHEYIIRHDAKPAPLGYKGYPKSICTSPNYVICHGIPNDKPLKDGDILNIDVSLSKNGAFGDTCKMFFVGNKISRMGERIVQCAQECLYLGINEVKEGAPIRNIGRAIEKQARHYGYSVVREFCGHGIGEVLHKEPQILHYDDPSQKAVLTLGMTFTIEPMINVGKPDLKILPDGWTAVTKDHSLSAQYEHTLVVTEQGVEILTLREEEDLQQILNFAIPA